MTHDETADVVPAVYVEVDDVDAAYAVTVQRANVLQHPR